MKRTSWHAATALLLTALGLTANASAAFPGANGKIAFERGYNLTCGSGNTSGIWTMRPNGSHRQIVFKRKHSNAEQPEISPSGRRIVFFRSTQCQYPSRSGLWIMRSDGTRVRPLVRGYAIDAAFSPNGRLVAYFSHRGGGKHIFITSAGGKGNHRAVTEVRGGGQGDPAFVGNRRILYTSFDGVGYQLYSIRIDGTHRRQITHGNEFVREPDVSPNRHRVTFADGAGEICLMKLDGSKRRCFVPHGMDPSIVLSKFSPDGRKLVFWQWKNGIFKTNRDGSHVFRLTKGGSRGPDWGPRPR